MLVPISSWVADAFQNTPYCSSQFGRDSCCAAYRTCLVTGEPPYKAVGGAW